MSSGPHGPVFMIKMYLCKKKLPQSDMGRNYIKIIKAQLHQNDQSTSFSRGNLDRLL